MPFSRASSSTSETLTRKRWAASIWTVKGRSSDCSLCWRNSTSSISPSSNQGEERQRVPLLEQILEAGVTAVHQDDADLLLGEPQIEHDVAARGPLLALLGGLFEPAIPES